MDVAEELLVGKRILVIWYQAHNPEGMQPVLEELRRRAGEAGHVLLEHAERLVLAAYPESSFDVVLSGVFPPTTLSHSSELLAEAARILKPSGSVLIQEPVTLHGQTAGLRLQSKLLSTMKLSGFVEVTECTVENHFGEEFRTGLEKCGIPVTNDDLSHIGVVQVHAKKPAYEVGASAQLSFATHLKKNVKPTVTAETAKIWSLSSNDVLDEDIDLMDSDSLLIEEDLLRPNPESLRSECGPNSGKKKACKNCTCGFAESLDNNIQTRQVTSSCGNCYLGDAFRCGSCPYLGMPAFKPGDQVRLTDRQLRPDQ